MREGTEPFTVLTVDLEEWFHIIECETPGGPEGWKNLESRIEVNTHRLLDLFEHHRVKATFFALGWITERHSALVREILSRGHELGCHSYWHTQVHTQSPHAFRMETHRAIASLEDATGTSIRMYRAPGFSITTSCLWAFEILAELDILIDASVFPGRHTHGGVGIRFPNTPFHLATPSGTLLEFPMSITRLGPIDLAYGGGGYFRALPWELIRHCTYNRPYTMTYFHPRDFDPNQPRLKSLSVLRTFKAFIGIQTALAKLDRFLTVFKCCSVGDIAKTWTWESAPKITIDG